MTVAFSPRHPGNRHGVLAVGYRYALPWRRDNYALGVSSFERCTLWVQVLYYPFYGTSVPGYYEGDYAEEDPQVMRQKRSLKPETGDPVILRCQPYKIPLTELLLPHKISPVEFFRLWPSLPAIVEYTGTYTYEGSGFKATAAQQYGASPFLSGLKSVFQAIP